MTTALPAKIEELSTADIMAMTGQADRQEEFKFPFLGINAAHENDDQKPIPAGTFSYMKDAKRWFSAKGEKIKFRIFQRRYQYSVFDDKENKVINRSKLIGSFREEAYDELGTIRCGKISKKEIDKLTPADKEKQEAIKCAQILYGVLSGKFVCPSTNEEQELDQLPVIWRTNGTNFMAMGEFIDQITTRKKSFIELNIDIGLRREKNGSVVYYVAEPTCDFTQKPQWNNATDLAIMADFMAIVNDANDKIREKYDAALLKKADDTDSMKVVEGVYKKVIDAEFKTLDSDFHDDSLDDIGADKPSKLAAG